MVADRGPWTGLKPEYVPQLQQHMLCTGEPPRGLALTCISILRHLTIKQALAKNQKGVVEAWGQECLQGMGSSRT